MKKIALISTFCDTDEKIYTLIENIKILKKLGLDTMVISPIKLPSRISELSDFVFFTKENPVLNWPDRAFTFWRSVPTDSGNVMMHHTVIDYGWAALYQVKKMSQIALTYDYDIFYHLIYDTDIDETIQKEILDDEVNFVHPRLNPNNSDELWETTLHFMVFDRNIMENVINRINLKDYLSHDGVAEGQVYKWAKEIPLKIQKYPVKDKIYYWDKKDFFNLEDGRNFKFFISKNDKTRIIRHQSKCEEILDERLRIFFYDVSIEQNIKLTINDEVFDLHISKNELFTFEHLSKDVKFLTMVDNLGLMDLTETVKKINRNIIYFD